MGPSWDPVQLHQSWVCVDFHGTCRWIRRGEANFPHRFIQTPMCKHLYQDTEFNKHVVERTSSRRWGYPDDLKGLMVFLASRASEFITGESIVIDGGVLGR